MKIKCDSHLARASCKLHAIWNANKRNENIRLFYRRQCPYRVVCRIHFMVLYCFSFIFIFRIRFMVLGVCVCVLGGWKGYTIFGWFIIIKIIKMPWMRSVWQKPLISFFFFHNNALIFVWSTKGNNCKCSFSTQTHNQCALLSFCFQF